MTMFEILYKKASSTIFLGMFLSGFVSAETMMVYSDKTAFFDDQLSGPYIQTWSEFQLFSSWDGSSTEVNPPEGFKCFRTGTTSAYVGWGIFHPTPQNLSRFQNGQIIFWLRSNVTNLNVEIERTNLPAPLNKTYWPVSIPSNYLGQWIQVPLLLPPSVDLSSIKGTFLITSPNPGTFFVDRVRYKTNLESAELRLEMLNIAGNTSASDAKFAVNSLPQGWVRSDQYLSIDIDPESVSWGIQLYTDNMAADANPKFQSPVPAGQAGSNPSGLVETSQKNRRLPMAWKIVAATSENQNPAPGDPNQITPPGFGWFFLKDKNTPAIEDEETAAFVNGEPYVQVLNNQGIHWGPENTNFGAENGPYKIFLEANFSTAVNKEYKTNKLILEYYTL